MSSPAILRIRRTDDPSQHLLVQVSKDGSKQLDLKLIGTEHEHLYHTQFKESAVKQFQSSNYGGSLDGWKLLLSHVFQQNIGDDSHESVLKGIELVAAISNQTVTITVRQNVGGIAKRLGSMQLEQDDEREAVSPFDWVDSAVMHLDEARQQLANLQASMASQREQVTQLNAQLDELVRAKKEHEDELMKKFAALLNAKKLKIRDQQRLLQARGVTEKEIAPEVKEPASNSKSVNDTGSSRTSKRKAQDTLPAEGEEMQDDVNDTDEDEDNESMRPARTPSPSDDGFENAGEGTGDVEMGNRAAQARASDTTMQGTADKIEAVSETQVPPLRALPFNKPVTRQHVSSAGKQQDSDEETDDDDEL